MTKYKSKLSLFSLKKNQTDFPNAKITTSSDANDFIRQFFFDDISIFESFFILMLNRANNTIGYAKISQGGISGTVIDIRIIAKYCVDALATSVILCHNHPSGNTTPSSNDLEITRKSREALKLLDCTVIDHLILAENSFTSMADEGLI